MIWIGFKSKFFYIIITRFIRKKSFRLKDWRFFLIINKSFFISIIIQFIIGDKMVEKRVNQKIRESDAQTIKANIEKLKE